MTTDHRAQTGAHSNRQYPIIYRKPEPRPIHWDRAALLFGLPVLLAAPAGVCVAQANVYLGLLAAALVYLPSLFALGAVMGASTYNQEHGE